MIATGAGASGAVQLITTAQAVRSLAARLRGEPVVAFDTEAASFHRYIDRVYLIQISSPRETAIVDPLATDDLSPLGDLLANPAIEVVFHDADYDLRSLDRDFGFRARRVFDTRIAAQLLGEPGVGLSALLQKYFGVTLNKKMQRADWSQRPLTQEMIDYAAADTSHLPALRDVMEAELQKRGRLDWAREEFTRLEAVRSNSDSTNSDEYLRLKGAKALPPRAQVILRSLHQWRENRARVLDRAPFRVLHNEALLALAQTAPTTIAAMRAAPGVPASAVDRYGEELIAEVSGALSTPPSEWPRRERSARFRPDAETELRFERLKQMRNERAKELGLEPGVLCANAALLALARGESGSAEPDRPGTDERPELRAWQRIALGEDRIRSALAGGAPPDGGRVNG
ncbi:MAG: ribonuclease D [Gemmatimonadetes bacterium]|nr:ribonuclease D [Gemmatimonadota bacterium]